MAMNGSLDSETRDNLVRSHVASKVSLELKHEEANNCLIYQTESSIYNQRFAGTSSLGCRHIRPRCSSSLDVISLLGSDSTGEWE